VGEDSFKTHVLAQGGVKGLRQLTIAAALIAKLSQKQVSHHYQDFLVVGPSVFFAEECVFLDTAQKAL
jgi:hypothetical protein